jgi:hypothetical protein
LNDAPAETQQSEHFSPSVQSGVELGPKVQEFLRTARKLLLNGEWVNAASGRSFETSNPATGGVLARVAEANAEDVDRAVAAARRNRLSQRCNGKRILELNPETKNS